MRYRFKHGRYQIEEEIIGVKIGGGRRCRCKNIDDIFLFVNIVIMRNLMFSSNHLHKKKFQDR